jgi:DNA-binding SARP family transcriptional activator/tetratricopeptide (TPR) repeat protein
VDTRLEFGILGPLEVRLGGTLVHVGGPRQRALLALLLCHANRVVSRDELIDELLGDQPAGAAERMLRVQVSRLRQVLGGGDGRPRLLARPPGYLLRVQDGELDLQVFEQRVAAGRHALERGDPGQAALLLGEAELLWRGRPLADLEFEPFARSEIQRLQADRLVAAEERIEAELALGHHATVCPDLERLVGEHPLRERLRGQLMLALYRSGRQADALETYRAGRLLLVEELGVEPGPGLRRVHEQVLAADPGLDLPAPAAAMASGAVQAAATRTLPRDIAAFTGRQVELAQLMGTLADTAADGGVVDIHAIGGMAGIGKTTFAVHAAHLLAGNFPDGQIFLPLHAHTAGQRPVDPADALASLLLTAGVSAQQIPPDLQARMALWRDRLAGKRLLLVLDDAASSDQVRPLLPGTEGSLVLVTSRRHLTALEGGTAISLDTLPPSQAADLLVRIAGRPGLSPADGAVRDITRLCGYLPLAIGMVARQLHHHRAWSVAGRAAELAAARDRLALMVTENLSVAAAFDLSYADLAPDQQRLFRRLGLHPGTDIDDYAAAALDGTGLPTARRGLEALYDLYLLTELTHRRYRMHDLIREHARALAGRLDPDGDRDQATGRLLDYYQHTAALAETLLARQARTAAAPVAGTRPGAVPALADREQALAWARAERASLLACLDYATGTGQHARVIALTSGIAALLSHDGPWAGAIIRHVTALRAARHLGDRSGQASALYSLADVRRLTGDIPGAARDLEEALDIHRDLGDRLGQANALHSLGHVRRLTGDYPAAARDLEEALGIHRGLGDRLGQAHAILYLGDVRRATGDYSGAARDLDEALGIYRGLGDRLGQAYALLYLGDVRRVTGDHPAAARDLEEALGIFRGLGHQLGQAHAVRTLGSTRRATGDHPGAARDLDGAIGIYRDIGEPGGEAEALNEAGTLHRICGDLRQARSCHQQALDLARRIGDSWDEAYALAGLGRCALAAGHTAEAEGRLRQALEIFQRTGAAGAADVSRELGILINAVPAG